MERVQTGQFEVRNLCRTTNRSLSLVQVGSEVNEPGHLSQLLSCLECRDSVVIGGLFVGVKKLVPLGCQY